MFSFITRLCENVGSRFVLSWENPRARRIPPGPDSFRLYAANRPVFVFTFLAMAHLFFAFLFLSFLATVKASLALVWCFSSASCSHNDETCMGSFERKIPREPSSMFPSLLFEIVSSWSLRATRSGSAISFCFRYVRLGLDGTAFEEICRGSGGFFGTAME